MSLLRAGGKKIPLEKTVIMGILNVTPDSFYDGGRHGETAAAVDYGLEMIKKGAGIIDVGGESTRPGAAGVEAGEEIKRVVPVIKGIREKDTCIPVSVDTYKKETAEAALSAGADIINDISGGNSDSAMMEFAGKSGAGYVIMHIQGTPGNMQEAPAYSDKGVVSDIKDYFKERISAALGSGIKRESLVIDPGIGFGKTAGHNLEIISSLDAFREFGVPVMTGVSRKSMIGRITGKKADKRIYGTAASVAVSVFKGADLVRVHDVEEMKDAAAMAEAFRKANRAGV